MIHNISGLYLANVARWIEAIAVTVTGFSVGLNFNRKPATNAPFPAIVVRNENN